MSYILYSLYAPHPIAINPFKSVLYATFVREREAAVRVANAGGISDNEQLVWVLWKILKGDGSDASPLQSSSIWMPSSPTTDRTVLTEYAGAIASAAQAQSCESDPG